MSHLSEAYVLKVLNHAQEAMQRMGPVSSERLCERHDVEHYVHGILEEEEPDYEAAVEMRGYANK
jgi:hypothetical protein